MIHIEIDAIENGYLVEIVMHGMAPRKYCFNTLALAVGAVESALKAMLPPEDKKRG